MIKPYIKVVHSTKMKLSSSILGLPTRAKFEPYIFSDCANTNNVFLSLPVY